MRADIAGMNKAAAVSGSILFFLLAPGVVAFLLPLLLAGWPGEPLWREASMPGWIAAAVGVCGLGVLVDSFARFALQGRGTPAPVAPTRHLVVSGLYRHVRNPMYVAVLAIILGFAGWFGSWIVLGYAVLVWASFSAFVVLYEEPVLRAAHGEAYRTYCANVGRWMPRLTPWRAAT